MRGKVVLPHGVRLSPAQLFAAIRALISYADAAKARGELILEAKFRERADQLRIKARNGKPG